MPLCNTNFSQILKLISRHEYEALAKQHHSGRSFRTASRWSQFVSLSMAQLSGRNSLRDIIENLSAQAHRLYHLGSAKLSRSNLSRINEDKPYELYEALFAKLFNAARGWSPGTNSGLTILCIRWMLQPLIYVCRFSHGLSSGQRRARLNFMWA